MLPVKALQFSSQSTRYPTTCAFYTTHTVQILRWGANKVRIFCWFWIPSRTNIGWAGGGSQRVESGWGEIKNKGNPHEFMKHGKTRLRVELEGEWRYLFKVCTQESERKKESYFEYFCNFKSSQTLPVFLRAGFYFLWLPSTCSLC